MAVSSRPREVEPVVAMIFALTLSATAALQPPQLAQSRLQPPHIAQSRRAILQSGCAAAFGLPLPAFASFEGGGSLDDLPPQTKKAYEQYWPAMQLAADYFVFELRDQIKNPQSWDAIGATMVSKSIGSAQSPSKLETDIVNPMRILTLAFPPDAGSDEMQKELENFQFAMFGLSKIARVSPGSTAMPSQAVIDSALARWDQGAASLNTFFTAVNRATGEKRLTLIPKDGKGYPRSAKLYTQLKKDSALCRNRGGEALAGVWGQLMVYGTVTNPCGSVNIQTYFMGQ